LQLVDIARGITGLLVTVFSYIGLMVREYIACTIWFLIAGTGVPGYVADHKEVVYMPVRYYCATGFILSLS